MLTFKILIDNRKEADSTEQNTLISEHALSIFIEYNGIKILCDTGASASFISNAANMGVDLSSVDICFISHGHSDHTGGIVEFINKVNSKCNIYLSDQIQGKKFYSCRGGKERDISAPSLLSAPTLLSAPSQHSVPTQHIAPTRLSIQFTSSQLKPITNSCQIAPNIFVVTPCDYGYPKPIGNRHLSVCRMNSTSNAARECPNSAQKYSNTAQECSSSAQECSSSAQECSSSAQECSNAVQDTFSHELALAIATPKGLVIFSPCTHNGIFNVIESCKEQTGTSNVHTFIGGLHLVDNSPTDEYETTAQITEVAQTFVHKYNNAQLFTGHCTGNIAINILNEVMPEAQFKVFYTGFETTLL